MKRLMSGLIFLVGLVYSAGAAEPAATITVLGAKSSWRYFMVGKTEQTRNEKGEVIVTEKRGRTAKMTGVALRKSELPPSDWRAVGFDDTRWPRGLTPFNTGRNRQFSLVCARGRFRVDDPGAASALTLSLAYRGGVVVSLNGKELSRHHMPKGAITPDTPAEDYEKDAYLDPDGFLLRVGWGDPQRYKTRFALRSRKYDVKIPKERLVKGVNVLALEVHRPVTDRIFFTGKPRKYEKHYCHWETLGLKKAALTAAAPLTGFKPATLRVWNHIPTQNARGDDFGDVNESLRPVRIAGCRSGAFAGVAMVGSSQPILDLKVSTAALKGGGGEIPASAVQVRYGQADGACSRGQARWFDRLEPNPPSEIKVQDGGAVVPLWITVHVPGDAKPGAYKGRIVVSSKGAQPVDVPIEMSVADWALPPVTQSESYWWLVQSPESLALAYKVDPWSPAHLALMGQSFDLLREVGTRIIYVPLFRESHMGNEHSMVRWIKKEDGSWACDLSLFDKYLDTAVKHLQRLQVICIHSWPRSSGGAYFGKASHAKKATPFRFTIVDPKTGKLEKAEGPTWDDKEAIQKLLRPAYDAIRASIKKRGLDEKIMMLGICHDVIPSKNCVQVLKAASGSAKWVIHCHPQRWSVSGEPAGYLAHVWGTHAPSWPSKKRKYVWKEKRLYTTFPRYGSGTAGRIGDNGPLAQQRASLECAAMTGLRGYGWCGADFWAVKKDKRGRSRSLLDSYPYDKRTNLGMGVATSHLLGRGQKGPVATTRHQMVRAGLQEVDARAFIERALVDATKRAKLGDELAARCRKLLDERQTAIVWAMRHWTMLLCADWEGRGGELFALAAEVAGKLK